MKIVKKIVLSNAITLPIVDGTPAPGNQTTEINTTTLSDDKVTKAPRHQVEDMDLTFTCECSGTALVAGTAGTLTITVTDGASATTVSNVPGFIKSAEPQAVTIDGERRLLQRVVWTPTGVAATTTTTAGG